VSGAFQLVSHNTAFVIGGQVSLGTDENKEIDLPETLPPSLVRAREILEPLFIANVLPAKAQGGHGLLAVEEHWRPLLETLPPIADAVRDKLLHSWSKPQCRSTPAEKWSELGKHVRACYQSLIPSGKRDKFPKREDSRELIRLNNWCTATIFKYTYPRLDINVSKMRNHLLKSPFCVHPKTGRVCVPIRTVESSIRDFDPFVVPTLPQLFEELDQSRAAMECDENENVTGESTEQHNAAGSSRTNWEATSLKQYFDPFVKEFLEPLQKTIHRAQYDQREQEAAITGSF
jgi:DNA primase small subunit